jgi:hypothetical protein
MLFLLFHVRQRRHRDSRDSREEDDVNEIGEDSLIFIIIRSVFERIIQNIESNNTISYIT